MPAKVVPPSEQVREYQAFREKRSLAHRGLHEIRRVEDEVESRVRSALSASAEPTPEALSIQLREVREGLLGIGLGVVIANSLGQMTVAARGGEVTAMVAVPRASYDLLDVPAFVRYLESVTLEELASDASLKDFLEELPTSFAQRILTDYDLAAGDDRLLNVYQALPSLRCEYARLGVAETMASLEAVVQAGREGKLVALAERQKAVQRREFLMMDAAMGVSFLAIFPRRAEEVIAYRKVATRTFDAIAELARDEAGRTQARMLLESAMKPVLQHLAACLRDPHSTQAHGAVQFAYDRGCALRSGLQDAVRPA